MENCQLLLKSVEFLCNNQLVCFPTETVYALAGRADNFLTVNDIYKVKKRPYDKSLSIFVKDSRQIDNFTELTENQRRIINYFSPGPVTFVLPLHHRHGLPNKFFRNTLGVRIPNHPLALAIMSSLNFPLAVTSVNISGNASVVKARDIPQSIEKEVAMVIKDDSLVIGEGSTVIDLASQRVNIIRKGFMAEKEVFLFLKKDL